MARQWIECVPNFSEGRRSDVIEAILEAFRSKKGCFLVDSRPDWDHNRLVVSLLGEPEPICEALVEAAVTAISSIDLTSHRGAHPRVGAVDVIPFIPLRNLTMEECVELARRFGKRYYEKTGVPVFFYENAALRPERKNLETIRRGQFEALIREIGNPERHPDIGEPKLHPTAGATVIGARKMLIAFNVNLSTSDIGVAKEIARAVRASSGGLCHVKAIGLALKERGMVQVSMNVVDYEKNGLFRVLELVRSEAARWGVRTVETEICGMLPAAAILDSAAWYMQLAGFKADQVIELRLLDVVGSEGK